MADDLAATRKRLALVKQWYECDVEMLLSRLEQAEQAAAHFYRYRQCAEDSEPCPEDWAYIVALGLGEPGR